VSEPIRRWPIRLTAGAEADLKHILVWSARQFGAERTRVYAQTMSSAIEALAAGPDVTGAQRREDIGKGLLALHVAREGRKGRHFLIFRVRKIAKTETIEVLRLLHDAMDLSRHLLSRSKT
jgi:toxin ParE1/3/4